MGDDDDLVDALVEALSRTARDLFREHPSEHFYYFALITTGEGHSPNVVAWSHEALETATAGDQDPDKERARRLLKWSYADSPYYCVGERHFEEVRRLWTTSSPAVAVATREARMDAMVRAMSRVDQEGLFGAGAARDRIVINVECMPPDHTNVDRARKLNPPAALKDWLNEAAEPPLAP